LFLRKHLGGQYCRIRDILLSGFFIRLKEEK
jgi:hypothetical protein